MSCRKEQRIIDRLIDRLICYSDTMISFECDSLAFDPRKMDALMYGFCSGLESLETCEKSDIIGYKWVRGLSMI